MSIRTEKNPREKQAIFPGVHSANPLGAPLAEIWTGYGLETQSAACPYSGHCLAITRGAWERDQLRSMDSAAFHELLRRLQLHLHHRSSDWGVANPGTRAACGRTRRVHRGKRGNLSRNLFGVKRLKVSLDQATGKECLPG